MSEERPSLLEILSAWKNEHGVKKTSFVGEEYLIINATVQNLRDLAETMIKYGYTYDELKRPKMGSDIAEFCWDSDYIQKIPPAGIKKLQFKLGKKWFLAIAKYSDLIIEKSQSIENPDAPKVEPKIKKEPVLDIVPKDRIIMDTSDMPETELDLEYLKELGIDESFVRGNK